MCSPDEYCWCRLPCGICSRTGEPCPKAVPPDQITSVSSMSVADFFIKLGCATQGLKEASDGGKTEDKS